MQPLKQRSLFLRHFLSYVFVLILPIIIVGVIVYSHFVFLLTEQSHENHHKMLEQVSHLMDTKLFEMTEITLKVASKPEISPLSMRNFYDVFRYKNELAYQEGNSFLHDFAIYFRGGQYIYSSRSTYKLPIFFQMYGYADSFLHELDHINQPVVRTMEDSGATPSEDRLVTFLQPFPLNSYQPYGTAIFIVHEESIREMYRSVITYGDSNVIVLNEDGRVITSLAEHPMPDQLQFERLSSGMPVDDTEEIRMGDRTYFASHVNSERSDWTYVTIVPKDAVMAPVNNVKSKATTALVIIFVLGAAVIYFTMYLNYNPIKKLIHMAEGLREQVESSKPALKQRLLVDLVRGLYTEKNQFNLDADALGFQLGAEAYYAVAVDIPQSEGMDFGEVSQFWHSALVDTRNEIYLVDGFEPGKLLIIMGTDRNGGERDISWSTRLEQFEVRFQQHATIGIGTAYEHLTQLGKSYLEAIMALQYQYVLGRGQVYRFGDSKVDTNQTFPYPVTMMEWAEQCVRENQDHALTAALERLTDHVIQPDTPLIMSKYVCVDLLNLLFKKSRHLPAETTEPFHDIVTISQITSKSELKQVLRHISEQLIEQVRRSHESDSDMKDIGQDLIRYVDSAYCDYNFSLQTMAERFNVTPSYMSKLFKERTGSRLFDYVNRKRMEKAGELLKTSGLSLREVVEQIGYSDVSSFIRKFKQTYGMTPGEYRKSGRDHVV